MVLNAAQNGAKCEDDKHKNTHQRDIPSLFEPLKTWLKRAKQSPKSEVLGAKSRLLGLKNYEMTTKLERLNGAKCRQHTEKQTKEKARKTENCIKSLAKSLLLSQKDTTSNMHFVNYSHHV